MARIIFMLVLCAAALSIAACGKRPGSLEPPEGATYQYPHTYPDPADREP